MQTDEISRDTLAGLTVSEATVRYGTPSDEDRFTLTTRVTEFRIELLNHFSADQLADAPQITEVTWTLSPHRNLTLWFEGDGTGGRYVHHLEWSPGQEF